MHVLCVYLPVYLHKSSVNAPSSEGSVSSDVPGQMLIIWSYISLTPPSFHVTDMQISTQDILTCIDCIHKHTHTLSVPPGAQEAAVCP